MVLSTRNIGQFAFAPAATCANASAATPGTFAVVSWWMAVTVQLFLAVFQRERGHGLNAFRWLARAV